MSKDPRMAEYQRQTSPAAYFQLSTAVGELWVAHDDGTVCLSTLGGTEDEFVESARRRLGRSLRRDPSPSAVLIDTIRARLDGDAALVVNLEGETLFRRAVLAAVGGIPRGEVRTYAQVAAAVGRPRAARAVGEVMRTNPIPVLIPCHRVVRTGGHLGNYTPDPETKRRLLEWEGALQVTGDR